LNESQAKHQEKLTSFFSIDGDNERFEYWKNYTHLLDDLIIQEDPSLLIMYFSNFVVVEFAQTGNAAYFYHRENFNDFLKDRLDQLSSLKTKSEQRRMNLFKSKERLFNGKPLYIKSLGHNNKWQTSYTRHMERYLEGKFK
jgi:EH_Signature domain